MQLGALHVAQDPAGIIELAVVQVGQGGQRLGITGVAAGHQNPLAWQLQGLAEPCELTHQHLHVVLRIEQLGTGRRDLPGRGIGGQQALLFEFTETELGGAMGLEQTRFGHQRGILAGLGMLHLIEQHRRHQHRIDPPTTALAQDHRPQLLDAAQGVGTQGLQLIQALAEQLGQPGLRPVHPEAAPQLPELLGAEIKRIGALSLVD